MEDYLVARAEALRVGLRGTQQRQELAYLLLRALLDIDKIGRPWLDDCINDARQKVEAVYDGLPKG